jgi:predicted nucleotidyltransferase
MNAALGLAGAAKRDVEAFVERLCRLHPVVAVILFGSRARGDWLKTSDIDLLVLSEDFAGLPHLARLEHLGAEWARVSHLPADVLGLTPHEFARRAEELSVVGVIAREGIPLYSAPGWVPPAPPAAQAPAQAHGGARAGEGRAR